jgi:hypothetical protein
MTLPGTLILWRSAANVYLFFEFALRIPANITPSSIARTTGHESTGNVAKSIAIMINPCGEA